MMCLHPFGLELCGTAIEWTAWATVALATVGAISIVVNGFLAWSTHRSAKSAKAQLDLERQQLKLFGDQLALAQRQFAAAEAAALPTVRAVIANSGIAYTDGTVTHVHGSQPAYKIEVWIRGQSKEGEAWGLRHAGPIAFLLPGQESEFKAVAAQATEQERCPFQKFFTRDLPAGRHLVGWTWERSSGEVGQLDSEQTVAVGPQFG